MTPSTVQLALQRILPFPCRKQYTAVILMPQPSRLKLLKSLLQLRSNGFSRDAKVGYLLFCGQICFFLVLFNDNIVFIGSIIEVALLLFYYATLSLLAHEDIITNASSSMNLTIGRYSYLVLFLKIF